MYKNYWLRRKAIREDAMIAYPLIYGFKTPERHLIKMVDGDLANKWEKRTKDFVDRITNTIWVI